MSNLVQEAVNLRNTLQNSHWDIESLMRLYCKNNKTIQFEYNVNTSSDFGCPINLTRMLSRGHN